MKKKFAIVFLSLFLVVSLPFAAHANIVTATGKYLITAIKHIPGGAKVNATNTATGAKHVINHGVSAPALGAAIGGGLVGLAVGNGLGLAFQAITGLALDAVDWVMDKENNQIKWKKKGDVVGSDDLRGSEFIWTAGGGAPTAYIYKTYQAAGAVTCQHYGSSVSGYRNVFTFTAVVDCSNGESWTVKSKQNPSYDPSYKPDDIWKKIPLNDLAKKVIEQADSGNAECQKTIEDYVTNLAKEGKLDAELDASTDITKPEGTEPDPDKDKECPLGTIKVDDICVKPSDSDPPLFCNSSEFTRKVCDWIDWTQEKPDDLKSDEGKIDVIDKSKDLTINENRIDFSNQCPAPTPINTSVGGFPISTELNYQPLCDFFVMLNPFVIGMGGISSALIIAGGLRRG